VRRAESVYRQEGKIFRPPSSDCLPGSAFGRFEEFRRGSVVAAMMTAATMMTAAVATTEMFTMMTAAVAMTEMFTMMTAAVAMTEMFTMMAAAVTDQKPAGKAVVRIVTSVVRIGIGVIACVVRIGIGIIVSVVRIVGVVTVISAPARKQRGHQQSRQNPSPGNLSPPAPDRFQLGKTSYLFKLGAGSEVVYLFGSFSAPPLLFRCQEDEKTRLDVRYVFILT
jgi:hypothetical protein